MSISEDRTTQFVGMHPLDAMAKAPDHHRVFMENVGDAELCSLAVDVKSP